MKLFKKFPIALCCLAIATGTASARSLVDAVEDEFIYDPVVDAYDIVTTAGDGTVTLSGTVATLHEKRRAEDLASTVRGVVDIDNNLVVEPATILENNFLAQNVEEALIRNPATESWEIEASADDGKVMLSGRVNSFAERELAERITSSVLGVQAIDNNITVVPASERTDREIRTDIEQLVFWDTMIPSPQIDVTVEDGNVTLKGSVNSLAVKNRLIQKAGVAGVQSIDSSGVAIDPDTQIGFLIEDTPDAEIRTAVENALLLEPMVNATEILVDVDQGDVSLRGTVDSLNQKRRAGLVARNTHSVESVNNRLTLETQPLNDATMESRAEDALADDSWISAFDVNVAVTDGRARLTGIVDSFYEKTRADDLVADVAGIQQVDNQLAVEDESEPLVYNPYIDMNPVTDYDWYDYEPPTVFQTDYEIRKSIADELFWSPFVDRGDITVSVDDGTATLTGEVDSFSEMDAAVENAYEGGATWVDNDLMVSTN